jgi:large subunit ribosomal protein L21
MKYAIVEDGGKQYKAVVGESIEVDHFDSAVGEEVDLEKVLLVSDGESIQVGGPYLPGTRVQATVLAQIKAPKVLVFKYLPKKRHRVKSGHRQQYTRLKIDEIVTE